MMSSTVLQYQMFQLEIRAKELQDRVEFLESLLGVNKDEPVDEAVLDRIAKQLGKWREEAKR